MTPGIWAAPGFLRLWLAGALSSTSLWLEVLAAALFTLAATGSPFAVAVVSACRAAPLLLAGAVMGVLADTLDRRRIVLAGLLLAAASSATIAILALAGVLRPWHLAVSALVGGLVYSTEMPARRRLIAEAGGHALVGRAVAIDSLTSFATRCAGPVLGGVVMQAAGPATAYAASAAASLAGAACIAGLVSRQEVRALSLGAAWRDLAAGIRFARDSRAVAALLAVTLVMNLLGYSYTSLVAPFGRALRLDDAGIGLLAAAEPAGALLAGLAVVRVVLPGPRLGWLAGGAAMLMAALAAVSLLGPVAPVWCVCVAFMAGGFGVAAYTNMQTLIALHEVPERLRSRVLGLVGMAVGGWPIGQLLAGAVAEFTSAGGALLFLGVGGLCCLAAIGLSFRP